MVEEETQQHKGCKGPCESCASAAAGTGSGSVTFSFSEQRMEGQSVTTSSCRCAAAAAAAACQGSRGQLYKEDAAPPPTPIPSRTIGFTLGPVCDVSQLEQLPVCVFFYLLV